MDRFTTKKNLYICIILLLLLLLLLLLIIGALVWDSHALEARHMADRLDTLNVNDGNPIIQKHEQLFQPGVTVQKDFFVENTGTSTIFYQLYLADISGGLADILIVTIRDGDQILYCGTAHELTLENTAVAAQALTSGQRKDLIACFYLPEQCPPDLQNASLSFILRAKVA